MDKFELNFLLSCSYMLSLKNSHLSAIKNAKNLQKEPLVPKKRIRAFQEKKNKTNIYRSCKLVNWTNLNCSKPDCLTKLLLFFSNS